MDPEASIACNQYVNVDGRRMFPDLRCEMHNELGRLVSFMVEVDGTPHYTHISKLRGRGPRRGPGVFARQVARDDCLMQAVLDGDVGPVKMLFRVPETAKSDFNFWA
eukprot:62879-Rhodomonas_salina.1